ncbi:TetR/AcrR family transcriptional regulator [Serinibacter arcticus]|uniref:Transcriptional regulator, TetR family n=1 Tax=Serinibacter arcticus TaxID=1655435 RepID=A0A4Z1DZ67_9MICO|nr:TetR/AcrR family transcriptional regulator [Serinibacter arcticus]TGO04985.1 Transcriptional regulator, TetR family [Serinibacter arcticus]
MQEKSPRGRHREAAENDIRILEAARAVFTDDPDAPISAVGARAGVGKSALYRRYASKEVLLQAVGEEVTETYVSRIERSHLDLDDGVAPRIVLAGFLADAASTGTHTMALAISGRFDPSPRDRRRSAEGWEAGERLVSRLQDAGALRAEVDWLDLNKLLETIGGLRAPDGERAHQLRRRYAALITAGLAPASEPLPGTPAGPADFGRTTSA